ncbi:protein of unknown function [Shewanella benthica]|uniref:Uncharacterized protein n=1 Tax=Shewanella benthica TaxID=43661 RepID=A0A330M6P1_9GAMM|nr:protein of unknown function [Shewanella benthica]
MATTLVIKQASAKRFVVDTDKQNLRIFINYLLILAPG